MDTKQDNAAIAKLLLKNFTASLSPEQIRELDASVDPAAAAMCDGVKAAHAIILQTIHLFATTIVESSTGRHTGASDPEKAAVLETALTDAMLWMGVRSLADAKAAAAASAYTELIVKQAEAELN